MPRVSYLRRALCRDWELANSVFQFSWRSGRVVKAIDSNAFDHQFPSGSTGSSPVGVVFCCAQVRCRSEGTGMLAAEPGRAFAHNACVSACCSRCLCVCPVDCQALTPASGDPLFRPRVV